jgi:hypothetical protein
MMETFLVGEKLKNRQVYGLAAARACRLSALRGAAGVRETLLYAL